ncbi:MAG: hypothetical protein ABIJ09_15735 [Pseudomonadota bacterium]
MSGSRAGWGALVLVVALLAPTAARAQFRNNGIFLPQVGYLTLELFGVNDIGSSDAVLLGVGGSNSIGYNFWVTYRLMLGFSLPIHDTTPDEPQMLTSLSAISGIRYNFLDEDIRPYVEADLHYLWFLYTVTGLQGNPALGGQAMFLAARGAGGLEWYFHEEMSLSVELAGEFFFTIGSIYFPAVSVLAGYTVYY